MTQKNQTNFALPRIVIVGGGAGGLELAARLGRKLGKRNRARITLVDGARIHLWKPLLHQVAAGTLDSNVDQLEYLALARAHHFSFRLGRMDGLDRSRKEIFLASTFDHETGEEVLPRQSIPYDTLVMALGSETNDFHTPGANEHAIMLDSPEAAEYFQRRMINACLRAQSETMTPTHRFTVTIIGGGATGVELSAELHMMTEMLSGYGLEHFDPGSDIKIVVVDAAPRLLQALPERLSEAVRKELNGLNIEVHTGERVTKVSKEGITTESGLFIPSAIVVWAAGIKAPDFLKELDGLETNRLNQLVVKRDLQSTRDPSIFAIGDCAACPLNDASQKETVPPRAQAAHQQAATMAKSIVRLLEGKPPLDYVYRDYGSLVSLGDYSTVGTLMGAVRSGSVFIEGKIAQWMYWALHKQHQLAVTGLRQMLLSLGSELLNLARRPKIKLH